MTDRDAGYREGIEAKLLPCPFCGNKNIRVCSNGIGDFYAICTGEDDEPHCGASCSEVNCETEAKAVRRWNTRTLPLPSTPDDDDAAYEIGKRDGYEEAFQELDLATGGDGEFKASTLPGETVDVLEMKARIMERFIATVPTPDDGKAAVEPCCPFCGRDPFHRVDNGVGMEAVAVTCCELGDQFYRGMRSEPETVTMEWDEFVEIGQRLAGISPSPASDGAIREALDRLKAAEPRAKDDIVLSFAVGCAIDAMKSALSAHAGGEEDCPDCDGSGYRAISEAGCCGNPTRTGECCGNAIEVPGTEKCSTCGGSGKQPGPSQAEGAANDSDGECNCGVECQDIGGGRCRYQRYQSSHGGLSPREHSGGAAKSGGAKCAMCFGTGRHGGRFSHNDPDCSYCGGSGKLPGPPDTHAEVKG